MFQRETISAQGGRVFTAAGISVNSGASYCLTAWIRATTDAIPFLGIQVSDAAGNLTGAGALAHGPRRLHHRLPQQRRRHDGHLRRQLGLVRQVVHDGRGAGDIVIKDENFSSASADFDMIQLYAGACPAAPASVCAAPVPNCQAAVCTAGVCSSTKLMPLSAAIDATARRLRRERERRHLRPGGSSRPCDR